MMDGAKSSQREKVAKMSKSRRENVEIDDMEYDMSIPARQSSSSSASSSSSSTSCKGSQDPGVLHRLTFRADPELLEPPGKQRKKLSRNEIEKLRRDRLNAYFMELAKLVPLVMQSNKKIDKASILRLTVAYLRIYHDLVKGSKRSTLSSNWRPDLMMYENLGNLLLESFGGFLLVINKKGILIFATEAITKYLGHSLSDVLGSEIRNVIHPNDYEILMRQFEMTESDGRIKDTDDDTDMAHVPVSGQRSFCIKMLNVLDPQSTSYELMHLVGHLKKMPPVDSDGVPATSPGVSLPPDPSVCLVAVAKLVSRQPIQELYPVVDSTSNQWITRHELDGKITYSDQRGALLTGFLPGESIGFSPYSLLHPDDVSSVVTVHNLFLENGCVPLTVFRMFTKSREILYVQTNTHMVIDTWTSKPKFIISINTVLDEHDGLLALEDQTRRIEDKQRCIEVSQDTCSTPSSAHNSLDSDESSLSLQDPLASPSRPESDCIIPEVEEVDDSTIDIIVGLQKFRIHMAENPKYDPRNPPHNFSSINMVFDTHATKDDGGKSIPIVLPSFLCGANASISSPNRGATPASRANSLAPSDRSCDEVPSDGDQAPDLPSQSGMEMRGCVAVDDAGSLAELLVEGDEVVSDAGKMAQNRDATRKAVGRHLLLRQLLVDKTRSRDAEADAEDGAVTTRGERRLTQGRLSSLEEMLKPRDDAMHDAFSQIKSLLQDGREPTKRSAAGIQNGRTLHVSVPDSTQGVGSLPTSRNGVCHLATSSTALPGNTAVLGNVCRSSEPQGVATRVDIPYHQTPLSAGGRCTERFTNDDCTRQRPGLDLSGIGRDGYTSYVSGNGLAMGQNGRCSGLEGQGRVAGSQEGYANPSRSLEGQGRAVGSQEMDCDLDVMHSSITEIISRLPSADKYKFLRHLMAEQEKVFTVHGSLDDATMGSERICGKGSEEVLLNQLNGVGNDGLHMATMTGQSSCSIGQSSCTDGQPTYSTGQSSYSTGQSTYATGQPTCSSTGQPTYATGQPTFTTGQPTYATDQPTFTTGQPTYATGQPTYATGQPTFTTGQPTYATGQPTYATGQPTCSSGHSSYGTEQSNIQGNVDAVTLNGWCHQDFTVTGGNGGYDMDPPTSSSSLNCWTSSSDGFDDSAFLAQQNDVSDWKSLVDDL